MKKTILLAGAAALLFAAGTGSGWLLFHKEQKPAVEKEIRVRVSDGNVEWSTGGEWEQAGSVTQLQAEDPYAARAKWEKYPDTANVPSVFVIGEVPKAEDTSSTPSKRPNRPSSSGSSGGGTSTPTQKPVTPPKPQDGEDVGWSDDLL